MTNVSTAGATSGRPVLEHDARFLIIRRDNIGDLVCTTPLLAALRRHFPKAQVAVLSNSYNAAVLDGNPDIDELFVYTKLKHRGATPLIAALWQRLQMIRTLRRHRFDVAILAKSSFDRHGLKFARLAGISRVIGFAPAAGPVPAALTEPQMPVDGAALHETEALTHLLLPLGINGPAGPLRVFPDLAAVTVLRDRLHGKDRRWVGVHISAREEDRRWPTDHFVALLRAIVQDPEPTGVLLLWSPGNEDDPRHPGDDRKAASILAQLPADAVLPVPTPRLPDLVAALSLCRAFVGADGGALHLAAASGLPMVALFENDPYKIVHWRPWQVACELVIPATRAIRDIPVAAVLAAWQRIRAGL